MNLGTVLLSMFSLHCSIYAMTRRETIHAPDVQGSTTKVVVYCGNDWSNKDTFNKDKVLPEINGYIDKMLTQERDRLRKEGKPAALPRPDVMCYESQLKNIEHPGEVALETTRMLKLIEEAQRSGVTNLHIATAGEGGAIWATVSQLLADIAKPDDRVEMAGSTRGAAVHIADEQTKKIAAGMNADASESQVRIGGIETVGSYSIAVLEHVGVDAKCPVQFRFSMGNPRRMSATDSLVGQWYTHSFERATDGGARADRLSAADLTRITIHIHLFGPSYATKDGHKVTFNLSAAHVRQYVSLSDLREVHVGFEPKVKEKCCCCAWWDKQTPEDQAFIKSCACSVAKVVVMVVLMVLTGGAVNISA